MIQMAWFGIPTDRIFSAGGMAKVAANGRLGVTDFIAGLTPAGILHVGSNTTASGAYFEQASADTDGFDLFIRKTRGTIAAPTVITTGDQLGSLNFAGYSGAGGYVVGAAIRAVSEGTVATTRVPAYLSFLTGTNAAPTVLTERMRITSAGNIGVGTTTPFALQDVAGGFIVSRAAFVAPGNHSGAIEMSFRTDDIGYITTYSRSGGVYRQLQILADSMKLYGASGTSGIDITTAGNVGVNIGTMLAWPTSTVYRGLQVGAFGGLLGASATDTNLILLGNSYFDGTNFKYSATAAAGRIVAGNSGITFATAASGTAGNTITWLSALAIDTSGRLATNGTPVGTQGDLLIRNVAGNGTLYIRDVNSFVASDGAIMYFQRSSGNQATLQSNGIITTSHEWQIEGGKKTRYKTRDTEIAPDFAMSLLRKITPRTYYMTNEREAGLQVGFFAEELHAASPLLSEGKNFHPQNMITFLAAGVQGLDSRLSAIERRLQMAA